MSDLDVRFSEEDDSPGVVFATLGGAIDASTVHIFQNELEEARKRGVSKLVMDVSKIKYVNSTGLGSLVKYADMFKADGGGIVLLRVPAKVRIVIEMLGLHEFFEMCNTEEEAVNVLSGAPKAKAPAPPPPVKPEVSPLPPPRARPASRPITASRPVAPRPSGPRPRVAPKAKTEEPRPAPPPPSPKPAPSRVAFPIVVSCSTCSVDVEVPESGNYKCPRCSTVIYVDGRGNANFVAPKEPVPIHMTLVTTPECTAGLKSFLSTLSERLGLPRGTVNNALAGLEEVLGKIASEAYTEPSTYHVLLTLGQGEVVIRTSDHGNLLDGANASSSFPLASSAFDEFEIAPHPRGGNLVRMVLRAR